MIEQKTKIEIIDTGEIIELYDNIPFSLNYQVFDIEDIATTKSSFTKDLIVPGSSNNNKVFSHLYNINVFDFSFNINEKIKCRVKVNDINVFNGYIQLLSVIKVNEVIDREMLVEYNIRVFSDVTDFSDFLCVMISPFFCRFIFIIT